MSSSSARPKRGGDGDDQNGAAQSSTKKPRFDVRNPSALAPDALEDDAVLDADEFGQRGPRVRRNAVKVEGFESDSENEGFDARADAKSKAKEKENRMADEDDMFAELEEEFGEDEEDNGKDNLKGKKSVRFLETDEIEGQVDSSKAGGKVTLDFHSIGRKGKGRAVNEEEEDDDSASDVGDEDRAALPEEVDKELGAGGKKEHAPLLDAFNMRAEQEDGRFDDAGNYVRKAADPDAVYDTWLEGVSRKDMRKAREAAEKREGERFQKSLEMDKILTSDILKSLILHLEQGETILEALGRLGKGLKHKPKWQSKKKQNRKAKDTTEDVEMQDEDPEQTRKKNAVEKITEAADILLSRGQTEIYDAERDLLIRQYQRETGEKWVESPSRGHTETNAEEAGEDTMWEFRWADARDGGTIHGPYDQATMQSWSKAGYFTEGGVEFKVTGGSGPWKLGEPFA